LRVSAAQLVVEDAWVQLAPPGVPSHAAYMRLINNNKKTLIIEHISAVGYAQVMLHQTKIVKDKVQMNHMESLEIPAATSVVLKPGTIHLMLMQPLHPQKIDDQVSITLKFDDGTEQQFTALVQANHE
jgi:copper(I)-binding protein